MDVGLKADGVVVAHPKRGKRRRCGGEGGGAIDHAAVGIGGIGDHVLNRGEIRGSRSRIAASHCHRQARKRLIAAADAGVIEIFEFAQLRLHLRFIFIAVAGEPALAPHIGLLSHDRAVGIDVVFQPVDLVGELLDAIILAGGGAIALPSPCWRGNGMPDAARVPRLGQGGDHGQRRCHDEE